MMKTINMLEFRQNMPAIMRNLPQTGEILVTYRGKPTARISPPLRGEAEDEIDWENDSLFRMLDLAVEGNPDDENMTNEMIDQVLYGHGRACDT